MRTNKALNERMDVQFFFFFLEGGGGGEGGGLFFVFKIL